MSHELIFDVLPFDPMIVPNPQVQLAIDVTDLAKQLQKHLPDGKIEINKSTAETDVNLYISTKEYGVWNVAGFNASYSRFFVMGWPKHIAKDLILWYRRYIPLKHRLYLVIPTREYVAELTANVTPDDIENLYPVPSSDE